uniref:Tetratricopeptide repeat protein 1 n=1 Tax=Noccaea caerulescens TaxID=107243 RepID=A0A1J3G7F7_NOCCA
MLNLEESQCTNPSCFFCSMKETNPFLRRSKLAAIFKEIPRTESKDHVLVLSGLWNIAMSEPDDPEFPSLGLFECMSKLIQKSIRNKSWLLKDQNIFIPYYAAHIIGSYVMNKEDLATTAVDSKIFVVPALLELLRGKISWVEQRAAARALGHLASHEKSFEVVSLFEEEIVKLSMEIASNCLKNVYRRFLGVEDSLRLKYQSDLLTRGLGGLETENQKAEEWGIQLQCWSLYLLNCFASRGMSIDRICEGGFLKKVSEMWGGLANRKSPGGIGLIKTLCKTELGRNKVSEVREVIERLLDLSRSSDDWKGMALDTLLLLLKDSNVRYRVIDVLGHRLVDLAEDKVVGDRVAQLVLQDFHKIKYRGLKMNSEEAQRVIENLWEIKVERKKKEKLMSETELEERRKMVKSLKKQGKKKFLMGFVKEAMEIYTVGIDLCPLDMIRDRVVLYSNRAQCCLLLKKAESAISDATRALCLSGVDGLHGKSLWRRSQAYDLKGSARESLMDCLAFVDQRLKSSNTQRIPYYAAQMIKTQMSATWIFSGFDSMSGESDGGRTKEEK